MDLDTQKWRMGPLLPSYLTDGLKFGTVRYMNTILLLAERLHIYDIANEAWVEMEERPHITAGKDVVLDVTEIM